MRSRFKINIHAIFFALLFSFPAIAQVSDPILTDEPEQNHYEERKKKEIEKAVESTKNENANYGGDVLFFPSEFSIGLVGGFSYGNYALKNNLPATSSAKIQEYGPNENKAWMLNGTAAYVNTLKSFEVEFSARYSRGSRDDIKDYLPKGDGALKIIRERYSLDFFWTDIWKKFFLKIGYALWERDGTATTPRPVVSFYRAHGPTGGGGYDFEISHNHGITFRPTAIFDYPFRYSELTATTGDNGFHFGTELDLRFRWRFWPTLSLEISPFFRYEYSHYQVGSYLRQTLEPRERDISFGIPVGIVYSF